MPAALSTPLRLSNSASSHGAVDLNASLESSSPRPPKMLESLMTAAEVLAQRDGVLALARTSSPAGRRSGSASPMRTSPSSSPASRRKQIEGTIVNAEADLHDRRVSLQPSEVVAVLGNQAPPLATGVVNRPAASQPPYLVSGLQIANVDDALPDDLPTRVQALLTEQLEAAATPELAMPIADVPLPQAAASARTAVAQAAKMMPADMPTNADPAPVPPVLAAVAKASMSVSVTSMSNAFDEPSATPEMATMRKLMRPAENGTTDRGADASAVLDLTADSEDGSEFEIMV